MKLFKNLFGSKDKQEFVSPMTGKCLYITDIEDQAFASKMMGDGFAVEITDGKVVAPFDGVVEVAFPTKHAYGLKSNDGLEVLVHIGMDTVELGGEGFKSFVDVNSKIKQGDVLCEVDIDFVKSKGKSVVSPVVFTDGLTEIDLLKRDVDVVAGEEGLLEIKGR